VAYELISSDDHIDINYLPADLWTSRLGDRFGDRTPHVEERDGQAVWICDGRVWSAWRGRPRTGDAPLPVYNALDRVGLGGTGDRRPAVAELRLADMDRDGVHAHVMYGPVFSIRTEDPELRDACYAAYNDWLADFCAVAPERLIGVPMLPEHPGSALAELERLAATGRFRQVNLQIAEAKPRLHDESWEPVWSALERTGMLLSFHVAVFATTPGDPAFGKPASTFAATKAFIEQFLDPFVDLFAWGILERHPDMKVVMAESGLGWLPWVVQELDHRYERLLETESFWAGKGGIGVTMRPSDLFKRQIYATFQEDDVALALLPFFGDGHVLWASDYPHPDSIWPRSREVIERQMKHLSPETRRKLTHDNAAALYRLAGLSAERP
jgi:predicted TIM-barrel fold metal-dependent hydrolase